MDAVGDSQRQADEHESVSIDVLDSGLIALSGEILSKIILFEINGGRRG
jgi:hypothetical protein